MATTTSPTSTEALSHACICVLINAYSGYSVCVCLYVGMCMSFALYFSLSISLSVCVCLHVCLLSASSYHLSISVPITMSVRMLVSMSSFVNAPVCVCVLFLFSMYFFSLASLCSALGAAFAPLKVGWTIGVFELDFLTGPGFVSALFGILNVIFLAVYFTERRLDMFTAVDQADGAGTVNYNTSGTITGVQGNSINRSSEDALNADEESLLSSTASRSNRIKVAPADADLIKELAGRINKGAVTLAVYVFFSVIFVFAVFETLSVRV